MIYTIVYQEGHSFEDASLFDAYSVSLVNENIKRDVHRNNSCYAKVDADRMFSLKKWNPKLNGGKGGNEEPIDISGADLKKEFDAWIDYTKDNTAVEQAKTDIDEPEI